MELPALHRKISANELVEASINTAFLNHFDSSHKYVEFNHHHSDDGSYSNLLQRYEELATEHLKLKRKYENVINDLHYKTMNSVDETVELKHTILDLQHRLKNERQKAYEQLYEAGVRITHPSNIINNNNNNSERRKNNKLMKETKVILNAIIKEKSLNPKFNDYEGHMNDELLDCIHNLMDEYDNQKILMSNIHQENEHKNNIIERLQSQLKKLKHDKEISIQKNIYLKKQLQQLVNNCNNSNTTTTNNNTNNNNSVVSDNVNKNNKIILPQVKHTKNVNNNFNLEETKKNGSNSKSATFKTNILKAKGKSKVIVLVDSNDKGQLSMLRDQLSKSRLENNKLKYELQQLRYK